MTDNPDTGLVPFNYNDHEVRTVLIDGEPWVVAKDVCDVLDVKDVSMALASLDDDERGTSTVGTPGGPQQMAIVNEPGLYSLILRSRKPEAKKFKRWVTHEVLPAIRKGEMASRQSVPSAPKPVELQVAQYERRAARQEARELKAQGLYRNPVTGELQVRPDAVPAEQLPARLDAIVQERYRLAQKSEQNTYQTPAEFEKHAAWNRAVGER